MNPFEHLRLFMPSAPLAQNTYKPKPDSVPFVEWRQYIVAAKKQTVIDNGNKKGWRE